MGLRVPRNPDAENKAEKNYISLTSYKGEKRKKKNWRIAGYRRVFYIRSRESVWAAVGATRKKIPNLMAIHRYEWSVDLLG